MLLVTSPTRCLGLGTRPWAASRAVSPPRAPGCAVRLERTPQRPRLSHMRALRGADSAADGNCIISMRKLQPTVAPKGTLQAPWGLWAPRRGTPPLGVSVLDASAITRALRQLPGAMARTGRGTFVVAAARAPTDSGRALMLQRAAVCLSRALAARALSNGCRRDARRRARSGCGATNSSSRTADGDVGSRLQAPQVGGSC
jgi:hypothetical protein